MVLRASSAFFCTLEVENVNWLMAFGVMLSALLAGCVTANNSVVALDPTALHIPMLREAPMLDRSASPGEWDDALLLNGTFSIRDGTPAEGEYPFEMRVGHNDEFLFGWVVVHEVPPNPYNGMKEPDHSDRYGYALDMFLDTKLGPRLEGAESWKDSVFVEGMTESGWGYWDGVQWIPSPESGDPEGKSWDGNRPTSGTWFRGWAQQEGIKDINWEFYIPLKSPQEDHDDFTVRNGSVFRMSLLFSIQGGVSPDKRDWITGPRDVWPGEGYTPHNYYDPTTWLRLQLT